MKRFFAALGVAMVAAVSSSAQPTPGIGLLMKADEMPGLREKIKSKPWSGIYAKIVKNADDAVATWPRQREQVAPLLDQLLDLQVEHSPIPKDPAVRKAGETLSHHAHDTMCDAAFVYLMTGDRKYADAAYDILLHMGKVNRWGWFPWGGSHMPQIHSGMFFRNAAFTLDFIWDALTPEQREKARAIIAEKAVEPTYRIVLQSPFMGLHHLRSGNQGNNLISGALIASLTLRDDPDARMWRRSFIQTFHWLVTHDVGMAAQRVESGGYWSVSMQNLYTGAVCLANATGIDLRGHPMFLEATYYPIMHEASVPEVPFSTKPVDLKYKGAMGVIGGKPVELPHSFKCGTWWYDYATRFPESPALYVANRAMVTKDKAGDLSFHISPYVHQNGHAEILALLWSKPALYAPEAAAPTELFKTTDRMSMMRTGYGLGKTFLYLNGDLFLSALGDILGATSTLTWHMRWHGYQRAESGVETEREMLAPSMVVRNAWDDGTVSFVHTVSGTGNLTYYTPHGQTTCQEHYLKRDRDVFFVRGATESGYFVFVDRVAQKEGRWHGWLWHTWDQVLSNCKENPGEYKLEGLSQARVMRPNADLAIQFVSPEKVAFEVESMPGQPIYTYCYDFNVKTLRAVAGGYAAAQGRWTVEPRDWRGAGRLLQDVEIAPEKFVPAYRMNGEAFAKRQAATFEIEANPPAGSRCRISALCRKSKYRIYENLGWNLDLELVDATGKVIASNATARGENLREDEPGAYRLSDPRSDTPDTPWLQTPYLHFDVPAGAQVAKIRGRFMGASSSNRREGVTPQSLVDLGPVVIEVVGIPPRATAQDFVAVVTPLAKGAPAPEMQRKDVTGGVETVIAWPGEVKDTLFAATGKLEGAPAELSISRAVNGRAAWALGYQAKVVTAGGRKVMESERPVNALVRFDEGGGVASVRVEAEQATRLTINGRGVEAPAGVSISGADLKFVADPTGQTLTTNSEQSRKYLAAGIAPLMRELTAERDALTAKGAKNLALGAKVTASGSRDERFGPEHVIDNKTWEYPDDGRLDYTLGDVATSPNGGYGGGGMPYTGSASEPMKTWPLYVRPTYWLLPCRTPGWVQLELAQESPIRTVRLLNTSNAGLNDFATMKFKVELLDAAGAPVAAKEGQFGKAFDRPFAQAFKYPELLKSYSSFTGMLEPGVLVPFGDGWKSVEFENAPRAKFVKVEVQSYWSLGGGLNEVQVY